MQQNAEQAAASGNLAFFSALSDDAVGAAVRRRDEDGRTVLHAASAGGHSEVVDYLLQRGGKAVVNTADDEGWTPLMTASSVGVLKVANSLVDAGADVRVANSGKRTCLHYAASKGHEPVVALLIKSGAVLDGASASV